MRSFLTTFIQHYIGGSLVSKTRQGKEIQGQQMEKEEIKLYFIRTLKITELARIWSNWNSYVAGGM